MEKVNHYNRTKHKDFLMGPSVKFVLAIIDSVSPKNFDSFSLHFSLNKKKTKDSVRCSCFLILVRKFVYFQKCANGGGGEVEARCGAVVASHCF